MEDGIRILRILTIMVLALITAWIVLLILGAPVFGHISSGSTSFTPGPLPNG